MIVQNQSLIATLKWGYFLNVSFCWHVRVGVVSFTAVFRDVTQQLRKNLSGERCVTSQKSAAKEGRGDFQRKICTHSVTQDFIIIQNNLYGHKRTSYHFTLMR